MKEYNDYVVMTRKYLKNYNQLKITIENLSEEIEAKRTMLQGESVAISRYSGQPGGGSSELNATEAAADRRVKTEEKLLELERNKAEIERLLRKIDRAVSGLSVADQELLRGYYIDGYSWQQLSQRNYCSEKWVRDKGNKALKEIAFMIFGVVTRPEQMRFVFAG